MADQYSGYDVARLQLDGADNSTTITDALAHTFTCNGTAKLKAVTSMFGGTASLLLDGTAGCTVTSPNSADWNFGSGDFCVDFWYKAVSHNANTILSVSDGTTDAWALNSSMNGLVQFVSSLGNISTAIGVPAIMTDWIHLAITRSGSTLRLFSNGQQLGSATITGAFNWNTNMLLVIGGKAAGSTPANGYVDNLRITKGHARYTVPFVPPIDNNFNTFDTVGVTVTNLGTNTRQVSAYGATNPDAVIAACDQAMIDLGWTSWDTIQQGAITWRVFRCINKDAVTYKYTAFLWDRARWRVTQIGMESWDASAHTSTNECWSNYRSSGQHGWALNNCDIIIFGSTRWLGLMTFLLSSTSIWSLLFESEREADEDTGAAGYPCFGMTYGDVLAAANDYNNRHDYVRYPRLRDGTTYATAVIDQFTSINNTYGQTQGNGRPAVAASLAAYGWDISKKMVSALKHIRTNTYNYQYGRLFGVKLAPQLGQNMDKVSVPVDADGFFASGGTATDHWILNASQQGLMTYNSLGAFSGQTPTVPTMATYAIGGYVVNGFCSTGRYAYLGTNANGVYKIDLTNGTGALVSGTAGQIFEMVFDGKYVYAAMSTGIYRIDTTNADAVTTLTVGVGGTRGLCIAGRQWLYASQRTAATAVNLYKIDLTNFTGTPVTITFPTKTSAGIATSLATDGLLVAFTFGNATTATDLSMGYTTITGSGANAGAYTATLTSWNAGGWACNQTGITFTGQYFQLTGASDAAGTGIVKCNLIQGTANTSLAGYSQGSCNVTTGTSARTWTDRVGSFQWVAANNTATGGNSMIMANGAGPDYSNVAQGVSTYGYAASTPYKCVHFTGNTLLCITNDNQLIHGTNLFQRDYYNATGWGQILLPR